MARPVLNVLECFAGIGGLSLGVHRAARRLGIDARTRLYVEREPFPAECLATQIAQARLAPATVFAGDIAEFPAERYVGAIDMVCGGFPCQDVSFAGKGAGLAGERSGLWFTMLDVAVRVGARYLFVENVAALAVRGLDAVLGSLAEVGFDARWCRLRASDVGAPHRRERIFILAHRDRAPQDAHASAGGSRGAARQRRVELADGLDRRHPQQPQRDGERRQGLDGQPGRDAVRRGDDVADASRDLGRRVPRRDEQGPRRGGSGSASEGARLADAVRQGRGASEPDSPERLTDVERAGFPSWPPGPDAFEAWRQVLAIDATLAPAQSAIRRVADGLPSRVDRLRALGNAVVPAQAEAAFLHLWRRIGEE